MRRSLTIALVAAQLSGCATLMGGGPSLVAVDIDAPNDNVSTTLVAKSSGQRTTVTGRHVRTTLDRGNDYQVTVEGPGYQTEVRDISRSLRAVLLWNIFFWPGLIVDFVTSAAWDHSPESLKVTMRALAPTPATVPTSAAPTAIARSPLGRVRIAVLDFQDIDTDRPIGRAAAENLRNALIERQRFTVLERAQIQKALQEQAFAKSGFVDSGQAVEIGKFLGAKIIVVGSVTKIGRTYTINARFIDVATGEAKDARSQKTDSIDTISNAIDILAQLLE